MKLIMTKRLIEFMRRSWLKPPHVILRWLTSKVWSELRQPIASWQARTMKTKKLLSLLGSNDLNILWAELGNSIFPLFIKPNLIGDYKIYCPGDSVRIISNAEDAIKHNVNLLGSGPVSLGIKIPWHKDFKNGFIWPNSASRRIQIVDFSQNSDIKIPWELSRLQWLIPAGQAYLLTGEERYSQAVREIIEDWIKTNPLGQGVNWACTMEVALRSITLVWLFKVFHQSVAWSDNSFRSDFLKLVYLHGNFIIHNLEWSDVNGNHLTANASGLVVVGLFFANGVAPKVWSERGWKILADEIHKQVFQDGVNFEGSTAYHRFATELFLLPALYRKSVGLDVNKSYVQSLCKMAKFINTYSRKDGLSPLWGDADDGRTVPFGDQDKNDHRYLITIVGHVFGCNSFAIPPIKSPAEVFWTLGPEAISKHKGTFKALHSKAFRNAGIFILRNQDDLVFVNCGPVGMAGRGGHGHNDCLSFEASLKGHSLITDCGTYVYSADQKWRNDFRSTGYHNTPIIDDKEQNRFVDPEFLWSFYDDAKPKVRHWSINKDTDHFVGTHSGYQRLPNPVTPVRSIALEKSNHRIIIIDQFEGTGENKIQIPYHFSIGVEAVQDSPEVWRIISRGEEFLLISNLTNNWMTTLDDGWASPSYGIKHPIKVLNFHSKGPLRSLNVAIMPTKNAPANPIKWLREVSTKNILD